MGTILCATRGGEDSLRTQDAVIARAKEEGADILFLYAADVEFLGKTASGVRTDVMQQEMDRMGTFLLVMACERASAQGVEARPVLKHGSLREALQEVTAEETIDLITLGRPAGAESVFQLAGLQKFVDSIQEVTGVETIII